MKQYKGKKILDVLWVTQGPFQCLGMVKAQDIHHKRIEIYVGIGMGNDEEADIKNIMMWGQKMYGEHIDVYRNFFTVDSKGCDD